MPILFSLLTLLILAWQTKALHRRLFPTAKKPLALLFTFLTILAAQTLIQTAWYYVGGRLGYISDIVSLVLTSTGVYILTKKLKAGGRTMGTPQAQSGASTCGVIDLTGLRIQTIGSEGLDPGSPLLLRPGRQRENEKKWELTLLCVSLFVFISFLWIAFQHATRDAINSPWLLLPASALLLIALLFAMLWIMAVKFSTKEIFVLIAATLPILTITLLTPFLYKLGYGFDGFLHRASENILLKTGTLDPKPLYYMGQYVFTTWLARTTFIPVGLIDIFLVPLGILLLPLSFLLRKKTMPFHLLALAFFLPVSAFVMTAPQSFAYLLGMIALVATLAAREDDVHPLVPILFALWSLAAHPLAGLPFIGACLALYFVERNKLFSWLAILATTIVIPLAFFFIGRLNNTPIHWDLSHLFDQSALLPFLSWFEVPVQSFVFWPDWASFVSFFFPFLFLASALFAIWKDRTHRATWITLTFLTFGMVLAGWFLQVTSDFTFLASSARGDYIERLFLLASFFLLLPAMAGLEAWLAPRVAHASKFFLIASLFFFVAISTARAYDALPRHDATIVGRGWSIGDADIEAVHTIEKDAGGKPYAVLANQMVSAASIKEFGFKRYANNIFYYPVPTGGPLYQLFLNLLAAPNRTTIDEAATLTESDIVYVVINNYWWQAKQINVQLKTLTNKTWNIKNGKVMIYRFDTSATSSSP